jgi:hypothetical protein
MKRRSEMKIEERVENLERHVQMLHKEVDALVGLLRVMVKAGTKQGEQNPDALRQLVVETDNMLAPKESDNSSKEE